jgi:hypothetical protein
VRQYGIPHTHALSGSNLSAKPLILVRSQFNAI